MIKVQIDELNSELSNLSSALSEFEGYSDNFIRNVADELDTMNSDFTNKISKAMDNMTDTKAPKLLKALEGYYEATLAVVDSFEEVDENIKDNINLSE